MKRRSFFGALAGLFGVGLGAMAAEPKGAMAAEPKGMMVGLTSGRIPWRSATHTVEFVGMTDPSKTSADDIIRTLEKRRARFREEVVRDMESSLWDDTPLEQPYGISYWLEK